MKQKEDIESRKFMDQDTKTVNTSSLIKRYGFARSTLLLILSRSHYAQYFCPTDKEYKWLDCPEFNRLLSADLSKIRKRNS